ncbi:MAG: hypothetical protein NE327_12500, partial [Lentisphaeraceae bacterium]|nr:hypothetical protein [Lentisphaeraceae bacterium]
CGNSTDNFDLCVIYFPDGNIYIESSKHYCGYEGTSGFIRKLQREDLKTFTESIKKAGFKHYKLVSLKK